MLPRTLARLQLKLLLYVLAICAVSEVWQRLLLVQATELRLTFEPRDLSQAALPGSPGIPSSEVEVDASDEVAAYTPNFGLFDRSILGRQDPQVNELKYNEKKGMDMSPGTTTYFVIKKGSPRVARDDQSLPDALEARGFNGQLNEAKNKDTSSEMEKRQGGGQVYITANTCRQPMPNQNSTQTTSITPKLVMYVSTENQKPGPNSTKNLATDPAGISFDSGFAQLNMPSGSDVYVGISAPNLDNKWFGSWNFEIAASIDGPYHSFNDSSPFLLKVDTDSESALFISYNLSDSSAPDIMDNLKRNNPYKMYAFPASAGSPIVGVERSFCAIKQIFNSTNNITVAASITNKFGEGLPKSQFHVQGLENGKSYVGFVVVVGNQSETMSLPGVGQVRGGGKVFQQINWTTKVEDSCQVLFDLDFCDEVAYAVPSSPQFKTDDAALKKIYDDQAKAYFSNFTNALGQIACDAKSSSQYSLARTCKDCEADYKKWLCSVLIPRCEDWSASSPFLQERNVNAAFSNGTTLPVNQTRSNRLAYSQSRNPIIQDVIKPGPYKEILPCQDLCFDIVRSCPAKMAFSCPTDPALSLTYGQKSTNLSELKCSFPGAVVHLNAQGAAGTLSARRGMVVALVVGFISGSLLLL